jgi:predicted nucleic acid-binding protein
MPELIFLDANVNFSAAYRPANELRRLWSLPGLTLLTSHYAISEVERNLPSTRHADLQFLLQAINLVPTPSPGVRQLPPRLVLPAKDVPIFQAAMAARATHLLTGDKRHFGAYFDQRFEGVLILTPRTHLLSRIACDR